MIIGNAKLFLDGAFQEGSLTFENGVITAVGPAQGPCDLDAGGKYLVPGFLDVHTHGAMNEDFSDGRPEGLPIMSRHYAAHGVTSFLATTMTLKEETLTPAMHAIRDFRRPADGAKCAGIHLEGPFLCYAKRGAQAAENLHEPDASMFHRLNEASGGMVRLITVAPEEEGAIPFIREVSQTCTVSLGHTTAGYETAMAAYGAGASHATHLFNAMPSFLHREPGVIGAALDSGATVELICDGLHIHPAVIRATQKLFGDKLVIISDSLRCAGMPDGEYELGGQPVFLQGGVARLSDGTIAGSATNVYDCMLRAISFGIPREDAVRAATYNPARQLGCLDEVGSIRDGKQADFVICDAELNRREVWLAGEKLA